MSDHHRDTIALHGGQVPDPTTNARAVPIYQTTSFVFNDAEHAANLFALAEPGNIYSRIMNPTWDVLEQRIAQLEGGIAACALASGQAAVTYSVLNICRAGDNIIAEPQLYGGTYNLFAHTLPQFGIEVRFADGSDPSSIARLADENTRAVFVESLGNPSLNVVDLRAWADAAHEVGVPLIVDNTVATPILCRPIEYGADIVVQSLTKFIGGHGTSIGGMIIDSGNFDWPAHSDRFPGLTKPDPSYHGVVWSDALGPAAYIGRIRTVLLRNTGAALSPFNAFQLIQGVETVALRMERHCANTQRVADYLAGRKGVTRVIHPSQQSGEARARADRYLKGGYGGLLGFELEGGVEAGRKFIDALQLFYHVANIGDARSLAIHPASTTHSQLTAEEQAAAGVSPGYVRLSIGIEHIEDILADLDQALKAAGA
jgi:O-acetylhomoserine (thiol)-lyase